MTGLRRRLDEARLALMLLSRLPVGRLAEPAPSLADAGWAYAPCGLVLGLGVGAAHGGLLALGATPLLAAVLALTVLVLLTGGLHFDGLADVADGMGASHRARRLEIMRDSRIGSYGVLALILSMGAWAAAVAALGPAATLAAFIGLAVASRFGMVLLLTWLPPARADGLGAAAAESRPDALLLGGLATVLALLPLGLAALPVAMAVLATVGLVGRYAARRLGGQTGDVLGAAQWLSEVAGWVALSLVLTPPA